MYFITAIISIFIFQAEQVFSNFTSSLKDDVMLYLYEETLRGVRINFLIALSINFLTTYHQHILQPVIGKSIRTNGPLILSSN